MQINLRDSGTFFFISDHCHVIENVRYDVSVPVLFHGQLTNEFVDSGEMAYPRDGWLVIIHPGSRVHSDSRGCSRRPRAG